jgi:hypothetical protein
MTNKRGYSQGSIIRDDWRFHATYRVICSISTSVGSLWGLSVGSLVFSGRAEIVDLWISVEFNPASAALYLSTIEL